MNRLIEVEQLSKVFRRVVRRTGRWGALRSLFAREWQTIQAVDRVSFTIKTGEMVGYLGPNGAGKSTTLKMLTGILTPSSGRIAVAGRVPHRERTAHVRGIGVVFGQRSQLWWDLPTRDSFELLRHIYRIEPERFRRNLHVFDDLLELGSFLNSPVRQLSLGQRMRAEIAAALLHDPAILFLDEPTIGLDLVARERIREFLVQINRERGVTMLLTTHDMGDIERLCSRVIVIDHGQVAFDGALAALRERHNQQRTLIIDLAEPVAALDLPAATLVRHEGLRYWLRFDRNQISAAELIAEAARRYPLRDLTLEEAPIETIIREIYAQRP